MQGPQVIVEVREAQTELNSNSIINGTSIDGKLFCFFFLFRRKICDFSSLTLNRNHVQEGQR